MRRLLPTLLFAAAALAAPAARAAGYVGLVQADGQTPVTITAPLQTAQAPGAAVTGASGNQANATATATLAGVAGKTTWITGFQCTAAGATAAAAVSVTVTGTIGGAQTYAFVFPAGATASAQPLIVAFPTPVPASAANTAIVVTLPASGAGGTNAACAAQGYQL
jgi:hypothetical protein